MPRLKRLLRGVREDGKKPIANSIELIKTKNSMLPNLKGEGDTTIWPSHRQGKFSIHLA